MKKFLYVSIFVAILLSTVNFAFAEKCLNMGMIPAEDPKSMMKQYKPMMEWLEKEMGICINIFPATDYTAVIEAMKAKKLDFAWFGPFSYVLANERANAEAFAVGIDAKGRTTYRAYLVASPEVAKELGISTPLEGQEGMNKLKDKLASYQGKYTFAFTDIASTSGYAVPRYFMHKAGIEPEKVFKKIGFLGTHDAVELAVKNKSVDIVADNNISYEKMIEEGKISDRTNVIIWRSPELPGSPMAYRKDLPQNIKDSLKKNITRVPKEVVTGYGKIVGYKIVSDSDYVLIKDIKKVIDTIQK